MIKGSLKSEYFLHVGVIRTSVRWKVLSLKPVPCHSKKKPDSFNIYNNESENNLK